MSNALTPKALVRWRADPAAFIQRHLIDPETGKPFKLLPAERVFLQHALATDRDGRLRSPDLRRTQEVGQDLVCGPLHDHHPAAFRRPLPRGLSGGQRFGTGSRPRVRDVPPHRRGQPVVAARGQDRRRPHRSSPPSAPPSRRSRRISLPLPAAIPSLLCLMSCGDTPPSGRAGSMTSLCPCRPV